MNNIVSIFISVIAAMSVANATIIPNTDRSEIRLGDGIKVEVDQRFPTCLQEFNRNDLIPEDGNHSADSGVSSRNLKMTSEIIKSYQSLDQYTHQSISADVQYMAYSGSASYSSEQERKFNREQITVGIQASADYGRFYIRNARLRPEIADLARTNLNSFYSQCGFEFVSGVSLGQGISIVLRTLDTSDYEHSDVKANAEAAVEGTSGSGSVSAAFSSVANSLMKYSSLEVFIYAFGAGELKSTSKILTTEKDIKAIVKEISDLMNQMKSEQAIVTNYLTAPYPIQQQPYKGILGDVKRQSILNLFSAFRGISSDLNGLKDYIHRDFQSDLGSLCAPDLKNFVGNKDRYLDCTEYSRYVKSQVEALQSARAAIAQEVKRCAENSFNDLCRLTDVQQAFKIAEQDRYWPAKYKKMLQVAQYRKTLKELIGGGRP